MDETITLSDAAYAVGQHFPHHNESVSKPTENKSVDIDMLTQCLGDLEAADIPLADKRVALEHLKAHANALDIDPEAVDRLVGDIEDSVDYPSLIAEANTFVQADELLLQMVEAGADDALIEEAYAKVIDLAKVDRDCIAEEFEGVIEKTEQDEDGYWHFTARVAQADKVNKNKRLYPREEFENNLPRANRLCKAGRFTGRDGHAGWLSDDKPSEICVRYDAVMLQDNDLIMEGVLVPTQAGENIGKLWAAGVQTEFSIIGYGRAESQTDEKGNWLHDVIRDYILDGCDPVRRGAASTRILKTKKPKDDVEAETVGDAVQDVVETMETEGAPSVEETTMDDEPTTKVEETQEEPKAPEIDVEAIKASIKTDVEKSANDIVAKAMKAAKEQAKLEAAKEAAVAKLAESDEFIAQTVALHLEGCDTVDAVAEKVKEITPQVEALRKPVKVETVGIHLNKDKERERFMLDGSHQVVERPDSIDGVKTALLEGLEDNGRRDPSNKRWCMEQIIKNYEGSRENARYLYAMTKQGFRETATTSTALGTVLPMVLPIIRQMLPMLIPYDIASVQPIDRPTARVYFYEPQYKTGTNGSSADGSNMDDSSVFDTGWADHTEADTKSQISFAMTHTDVTAEEKSVYWDLTSVVIQDMQAYYSIDAEASMLSAAVDYLALEINMKFLETLSAGAGINAGTFGTALPASGFENLNDWLTWGLSQYLNRASADISKKMYQSAGWIITGPTQATLFEASNAYSKLPAGAVREFGSGLRQTGTWQNIYNVYVCDWAETLTSLKNKMLIGYRPQDWNRAAAVFCPYIPLYISPTDATASTNTIAKSASSRNAQKVLQANGLATLTVSSAAGTALTYVN